MAVAAPIASSSSDPLWDVKATVTSTNANAPWTIITWLAPVNTVSLIHVSCVGVATISGNVRGVAFGRELAVRRGASGAAAVIASSPNGTLTVRDTELNTTNISFSTDGSGNLVVTVTGTASDTINWKAHLRVDVQETAP